MSAVYSRNRTRFSGFRNVTMWRFI